MDRVCDIRFRPTGKRYGQEMKEQYCPKWCLSIRVDL